MNRSISARAQEIWYGKSPWRWVLKPLAWLYGLVIRCRRGLFSCGILRSVGVSVPVIVVGNITVGGTGKTPVTLWLAERLAARGRSPGIVSRGYGGRTGPDPVAVTPDSDPAVVGDEALLLATRGPFPVVVHPDRVAAATRAVELGADVIISDDGLQHYRLRRDFEIVVVDGTRHFGNRQLLPAGPLREPLSRLDSMQQLLVQRGADGDRALPMRATDRPPLEFRLLAADARSLDNSTVRPLDTWSGETVHAVAGIGNPERFFRLLETSGIEVIRHPLPDHAEIGSGDLNFADNHAIFMTEKDAVKCRGMALENGWYVPVTVAMDEIAATDFVDRVLRNITPAGSGGDTTD